MSVYQIIWSDFAEKQLDAVYGYYAEKVSGSVAKRILKKLILGADVLIHNPYVGQKEIWLEHKTITYRYIVVSNYKLIYSVDESNKFIKIADVFDARQNPTKLERNE